MENNFDSILSVAQAVQPDITHSIKRDQLTLISNSDTILDLLFELRDNPKTGFDMLTDITAIDWAKPGFRYEIVYFLYSNFSKIKLRIKVPVHEKNLITPSVTSVWPSANWYERETFDMYGIKFSGHPNLRRFYMPEDFTDPISGESLFPLRKDFPLMGIPDSMPLPPYPEKYGDIK
jgi:NADH-quinone oxidoreductase subunit C